MLAALRVADKRILEIVAQYGAETLATAQQALADYAATKALAVQRTIPDGTHAFWDFLDDDYNSPIPVRVRCEMCATGMCTSISQAPTRRWRRPTTSRPQASGILG